MINLLVAIGLSGCSLAQKTPIRTDIPISAGNKITAQLERGLFIQPKLRYTFTLSYSGIPTTMKAGPPSYSLVFTNQMAKQLLPIFAEHLTLAEQQSLTPPVVAPQNLPQQPDTLMLSMLPANCVQQASGNIASAIEINTEANGVFMPASYRWERYTVMACHRKEEGWTSILMLSPTQNEGSAAINYFYSYQLDQPTVTVLYNELQGFLAGTLAQTHVIPRCWLGD